MLVLVLVVAMSRAALQPPEDFNQLRTFLTFTRTPSGNVVETRVRIGTFDEHSSARRGAETNWFDRSVRDLNGKEPAELSYADTKSCPQVRHILLALERLPMPRPDVPGYGREPRFSTVDGVSYKLDGTSLHKDGQDGDFSIESNIGSPAARWVERMLKVLEPCWRRRH